jgi:hypothetical protein
MLGEHHTLGISTSDPKMRKVDEWLADLCKIAPECLDIMAEIPPYNQVLERGGEGPKITFNYTNRSDDLRDYRGLYSITSRFENCMSGAGKMNCCGGTTRFHVVDMRNANSFLADSDENPKSAIQQAINHIAFKNKTDRHSALAVLSAADSRMSREFYVDTLRYIAGLYRGHAAEYMKYISRLLARDAKFLNAKHEKMFYEQVYWPRIDRAVRKNPQIANRARQALIDVYSMLSPDLFFTFTFQMDLYTVMRMFTKFDSGKTSPRMCPMPACGRMKNVIFYGGKCHALIYAKVLENMGLRRVLEVYNAKGESGLVRLPAPFDFFAS